MNRLLNGLSWGAFALVTAFCALQALEWVLAPKAGVVGAGAEYFALGLLSRFAVYMVTGATMLVSALVVLNAAGRAGRESFLVAAAAAIAGAGVSALVRYAVGATPADEGPGYILLVFSSWLGSSAILVAAYVYYLRAQGAQDEARGAELRRGALETQQLATRLRLLQAQVEPHFLFNTLSNARRLCQSDAAAGRAMLGQLTRYLRGALPRLRENETSLAEEIDLVSAYLGLQKIRMGERLETSIEAPEPLLAARVPPMMLATLVENAIKHGIAPLAEGGSIRVKAERAEGALHAGGGDALRLTVSDTGRGLTASSGAGVGLANIRARLAALYGNRAALELQANAPRGVAAVITLPITPSPA
jgi:signal transduction histidine kinase